MTDKKKAQKKLNRQQLLLIDALLSGGMDEQQALAKHGVRYSLFRRWLKDPAFSGELDFRLKSLQRQCGYILTRYAQVAAAKLVALTESDKDETVRKACLDIIAAATAASAAASADGPAGHSSAGRQDTDRQDTPDETGTTDSLPLITPEKASKLLAILAEDEDEEAEDNQQKN